jgi:hypothetical protein
MMTSDSMTERESMIQIYSDFHKEAYGFRPRYNYHEYTLEQLKADWVRFDEICEWNEKEEKMAQEWAQKEARKAKAEAKREEERVNELKTLGGQFPELAALLAA